MPISYAVRRQAAQIFLFWLGIIWTCTAFAATTTLSETTNELENLPAEALAISVLLSLIGGATFTAQKMANPNLEMVSVKREIIADLFTSILIGLIAFFFSAHYDVPKFLQAGLVTLAGYGGSRVLEPALQMLIAAMGDYSGGNPMSINRTPHRQLVTQAQLAKLIPAALAAEYCSALNEAMHEFGITTEQRIEMFLAQLLHESGKFQATSENLNYSADGLANTWPSRYAVKDHAGRYVKAKGRFLPNQLAKSLHRRPEAIANNVYANRMGNGAEQLGRGWAHRGAGLIQLTGFDNQSACAAFFGIPTSSIGDWLRTPVGACRSAAWFWNRAGCNKAADAGSFDRVSDLINLGRETQAYGDAIGFEDRAAYWEKTQAAIPPENFA